MVITVLRVITSCLDLLTMGGVVGPEATSHGDSWFKVIPLPPDLFSYKDTVITKTKISINQLSGFIISFIYRALHKSGLQ